MTNCHIIYLIQKKRGKDMKQSRRIELCKQFEKHPLKREYERKKSKICKRKPFSYYLLIVSLIIPVIMFFVYGYLFCSDDGSYEHIWGLDPGFCIVLFGILNIVFELYLFGKSVDWFDTLVYSYNKEELKKLENEYEKKGLIEMPESELWKHECCEYDDYREMTVCCVTKQPLSYKDYSFCKTPGNCKYCRTFVSGYLGSDAVEWWGKSHEYKR